MDALTQLIEPFTCNRANPLTDALCREGIKRVARSLRTVFHHGANAAAREDMCVASLFGGLALANAGLGAVHGFAGPIGGMFDAPHGALCAALLPRVMRVNQVALRQREPHSEVLRRYEEVASILAGKANAPAEEGADWVETLIAELKIPRLREHGIEANDFPTIIEKAQRSSSMKANPIQLTPEELNEALEKAF
jgi:alcohol dehydrogenase class IV